MFWRLTMKMRWMAFLWNLHILEANTLRCAWIWVGHMGVSFSRTPRFCSKLMVKNGTRKGIRVSQFGPLVVTWEEAR